MVNLRTLFLCYDGSRGDEVTLTFDPLRDVVGDLVLDLVFLDLCDFLLGILLSLSCGRVIERSINGLVRERFQDQVIRVHSCLRLNGEGPRIQDARSGNREAVGGSFFDPITTVDL